LTVLSAVLKGAAGVVTAGAAALGAAFGVVVAGFAGTNFAVAGVPAGGGLAGALVDATALGAEEVDAPAVLGLVAGVTDFGATPGLAAEGVTDLATGLLTVADLAAGLRLAVPGAGEAGFEAAFVGFGAGADPVTAGLVAVPEAGAEVPDAGF
jgi:hypothetical protein